MSQLENSKIISTELSFNSVAPLIHMLVWIENAPTLEKKSEEEIVQFVDQYLTCSADNKETTNLVNLQTHKHSRTCRKVGKPIFRFGFPLPPLPRNMLLYPLAEDVDKYKKKYKELRKMMNEYKATVDMKGFGKGDQNEL